MNPSLRSWWSQWVVWGVIAQHYSMGLCDCIIICGIYDEPNACDRGGGSNNGRMVDSVGGGSK